MIPNFPHFEVLDIHHKDEVRTLLKNFPSYSDFNFVSLLAFNVANDFQISMLGENLVIKFKEYTGDEYFFSILGKKVSEKDIKQVLDYAKTHNIQAILKLVPYDVIKHFSEYHNVNFVFEEDRDNFDYIISLEEMSILYGTKFHNKRIEVNRFLREYININVREINLQNVEIKKQIEKLFEIWEIRKNKTRKETHKEYEAMQRLINHSHHFDLFSIGIYDGDTLIAFLVTELLDDKNVIGHFTKADTKYHGIYEYLYHVTAKKLHDKGFKHINLEQDLGIPGLRFTKEQWNPIEYLKKYNISLKNIN